MGLLLDQRVGRVVSSRPALFQRKHGDSGMICWTRPSSPPTTAAVANPESPARLMPNIFTTSLAAIVAAAFVSLTSCANTESPSATLPTTPAQTPPRVPADSPPAARSESGESNGKTYAIAAATIAGATPDGGGRWHAEVAQLSGGDPAVAEAFNKAGEASAHHQIEQVRADADSIPSWTFEVKSESFFRPTALAQLLTGVY
jgi:hypothetical protein